MVTTNWISETNSNKMASTGSNTSILNTSRARQRRKTRKESVSNKENSTINSENTINNVINEEKENRIVENEEKRLIEDEEVHSKVAEDHQLTTNGSPTQNESSNKKLEGPRGNENTSNGTNGD